jgi:hypothetical protein
LKGLAALVAATLLVGQCMGNDLDREIRLRPWAMAATWGCRLGLGFVKWARPSFGRLAEDLLLERCELLLEQVELHLRIDITFPQPGILSSKLGDLFGLSDDGFLEVGCDLLEEPRIVDSLQRLHAEFSP